MALRKLLMRSPQMSRLARKRPSYSTAGIRRIVNSPEHKILPVRGTDARVGSKCLEKESEFRK